MLLGSLTENIFGFAGSYARKQQDRLAPILTGWKRWLEFNATNTDKRLPTKWLMNLGRTGSVSTNTVERAYASRATSSCYHLYTALITRASAALSRRCTMLNMYFTWTKQECSLRILCKRTPDSKTDNRSRLQFLSFVETLGAKKPKNCLETACAKAESLASDS